jgi:hypothetical protein
MPGNWLAKAYEEVRHHERERRYWAERDRLPGTASKPRVGIVKLTPRLYSSCPV